PKHAASKKGFNDFVIDGKLVSFEDRFEIIETHAAPVFRKIIGARAVTNLSDAERKKVSKFIAVQSFRTAAFFEGMRTGEDRSDFGRIFTQLWDSFFLISDQIQKRPWALMVIEHDDVFYLGDHPVVHQFTKDPNVRYLGFDIQGVEAFLPLTPKIALYIPCSSTSSQIIKAYEDAAIIHKCIRISALSGKRQQKGEAEALQMSQGILLRAHALYQALTTGVSVKAKSENIENLNYLQSSWAHSMIYSNQRDFAFAKHVFQKTPQYREFPKTSVAIISPLNR
ncbi:MAG TPA: DUF4238 domain-containing protein, partial [Hyphomicrobiales bacterium]|nr:DUF4238 domain-containing protein [Hyphomicrobiales bacterium]